MLVRNANSMHAAVVRNANIQMAVPLNSKNIRELTPREEVRLNMIVMNVIAEAEVSLILRIIKGFIRSLQIRKNALVKSVNTQLLMFLRSKGIN